MTLHPHIVYPRAGAQPAPLSATDVIDAYGRPDGLDGTGVTIGIIELGGLFRQSDLNAYTDAYDLPRVTPTVVTVDGATPTSDDADAEVALDIQIAAAVAPRAAFRIYFAPNTDQGFEHAVQRSVADGCNAVSISWGQAESEWDRAALTTFSQTFQAARVAGVAVYAAAGDSGATDSTSTNVTDYPASDRSVIGCGGTRLLLANKIRSAETVWNDGPSSATGGGVSKVFNNRHVPDITGNADPMSGYRIVVNSVWQVVGGTSAVAPLMAGMYALLREEHGQAFDASNLYATNPQAFYDVTVGGNGGFNAGPGRDDASGWGAPDCGLLLKALGSGIPAPVPPDPSKVVRTWDDPADVTGLDRWAAKRHTGGNKIAQTEWKHGH